MSDTLKYLQSREAVLGRRMTLSHDAELAAEQGPEALGGRELFLRWLRDVAAEFDCEVVHYDALPDPVDVRENLKALDREAREDWLRNALEGTSYHAVYTRPWAEQRERYEETFKEIRAHSIAARAAAIEGGEEMDAKDIQGVIEYAIEMAEIMAHDWPENGSSNKARAALYALISSGFAIVTVPGGR